MRAIALLIVFLMFCVNVYAEDSSGLLIIKNPNLSAAVVSSKVDMGKMDYAYNNPTTVDKSGNFYFCSSENNRLDSLWKVSRVDVPPALSGFNLTIPIMSFANEIS